MIWYKSYRVTDFYRLFDTLHAPAYSAVQGSHTFRECAPPSAAPRRFFADSACVALASPEQVRFMARGNFGERLKRERELREVSPNEIVVATRISLRFLEALENEDWDKLPGGVFNRGFVRAIARYLGLDEEHLLAEYDMARGDQTAESAASAENRTPSPPKWIAVALALGALVVIAALVAAGIYGWRRYAAHRRAKQSSALTTPWHSFSLSRECKISHNVVGVCFSASQHLQVQEIPPS